MGAGHCRQQVGAGVQFRVRAYEAADPRIRESRIKRESSLGFRAYEAAEPGKTGKTWVPAMAGSRWALGSSACASSSSADTPHAFWNSASRTQAGFMYSGDRTALLMTPDTPSSMSFPNKSSFLQLRQLIRHVIWGQDGPFDDDPEP